MKYKGFTSRFSRFSASPGSPRAASGCRLAWRKFVRRKSIPQQKAKFSGEAVQGRFFLRENSRAVGNRAIPAAPAWHPPPPPDGLPFPG